MKYTRTLLEAILFKTKVEAKDYISHRLFNKRESFKIEKCKQGYLVKIWE